jgi:protoporphyrinogen/coproporphyrinogen III oxidase
MHQLSMRACFPSMKKWEENHGSLTKGMWKQPKFLGPPFIALKRGVQSLVDALETRLRPSLRLGTEVQNVSFHPHKAIVQTAQGSEEFDYVISALPCHALGKLLFPELLEIEMKSVNLVHLGYTRQVAPKRGFGYIVSSQEKHPMLGVIFDSMSFPQHNRYPEETRLTAFVRGTVADVLEGLREHLKIEEQPAATLVTPIENAFPQMTVGHTERMHALEKKIAEDYPRLKVAGNFLYGVGVSDCITAARSAVENLLSVVPS